MRNVVRTVSDSNFFTKFKQNSERVVKKIVYLKTDFQVIVFLHSKRENIHL